MAVTPDQLTPILLRRLADALNKRIGQSRRTDKMQEAADDLGCALSTFKTRIYAQALPRLDEWVAMRNKWPGLAEEVLDGLVEKDGTGTETAELVAAAHALQEIAERIAGMTTQPVPIKGKVS